MDLSQDTQRRIHDSIMAEINSIEEVAMKDWFYLSRHTECLRNIRLNLEGYLTGEEEVAESSAEYLLMLVNILLRVAPPLPSDKMVR